MAQYEQGLWSSIKAISETQSGRQALATTGAVIAAAYMGYVGPELFTTMHEALAVFAEKYPFMDPVEMSRSLWEGAKYFSASLVDYASNTLETFGVDMTKTVREGVNACRDFITRGGQRGLEAARVTLTETAAYIGGHASEITATIKSTVGACIETFKSNWQTILAGLAVAREAYEYYETGESIYHRLFKRGKNEVAETAPEQTSNDEVNLAVNAALAGTDVLISADAQMRKKAVADKLSIDPDQVIWISEKMYEQLEKEGDALSNVMDASQQKMTPVRRSRSEINISDLSNDQLHSDMTRAAIDMKYKSGEKLLVSPKMDIDLLDLPGINLAPAKKANKFDGQWAENTDALVRMKSLGRLRRKSALMEFDLSDPLAFQKGAQGSDDDYDLRNDVFDVVHDKTSGSAINMAELA